MKRLGFASKTTKNSDRSSENRGEWRITRLHLGSDETRFTLDFYRALNRTSTRDREVIIGDRSGLANFARDAPVEERSAAVCVTADPQRRRQRRRDRCAHGDEARDHRRCHHNGVPLIQRNSSRGRGRDVSMRHSSFRYTLGLRFMPRGYLTLVCGPRAVGYLRCRACRDLSARARSTVWARC